RNTHPYACSESENHINPSGKNVRHQVESVTKTGITNKGRYETKPFRRHVGGSDSHLSVGRYFPRQSRSIQRKTMMTMLPSNGPNSGSPATARIQRQGAELKANLGARASYTLTLLADGSTMLVRLQAPFNDNTASYRRTPAPPL